jgi:hypothetical protein
LSPTDIWGRGEGVRTIISTITDVLNPTNW